MKNKIVYAHPELGIKDFGPSIRGVTTKARTRLEEIFSPADWEFSAALNNSSKFDYFPDLLLLTKRSDNWGHQPFPNHVLLPILPAADKVRLKVCLPPGNKTYIECMGIPLRSQKTYEYDPVHKPVIKHQYIASTPKRVVSQVYAFGLGDVWIDQ